MRLLPIIILIMGYGLASSSYAEICTYDKGQVMFRSDTIFVSEGRNILTISNAQGDSWTYKKLAEDRTTTRFVRWSDGLNGMFGGELFLSQEPGKKIIQAVGWSVHHLPEYTKYSCK